MSKATREKHKSIETKPTKTKWKTELNESEYYLFSMSLAPKANDNTHWFQIIVAAFFTAVIIMITRMATYERPMQQFFWSNGNDQLTDFFSYYKMVAILICAILALVIMLYRVFTQSFYIKRSFVYLPMILYSTMVVLSYIFSEYKEFALWGWNDRFEGTLVLLSYMVMLFFIINTVNSEKNLKWIIYPLAITSTLLGILGLSQASDHDFFRTEIGKKLITPSWFWDRIDSLNFTFQNKEIYQTVYNINYVSFYLTLLIPLFGLLFIRSVMLRKEEPIWKKVLWGASFTLLIFNLIGSASSGGLMGMSIVVLLAIIILNRRIIAWWKPIFILLILTVIVASISFDRWMPELSSAINGVLGRKAVQAEDTSASGIKQLDYMETTEDAILIGYGGYEVIFTTFPDDPSTIKVTESTGEILSLIPTKVSPLYQISDARFRKITVRPAHDDDGNNFIVIGTDNQEWPFSITESGPKYYNGFGNLLNLRRVPAIGWKDNQSFGSGRGYIWSRTIPMMKETLLLGHGADTYSAYFPQDDYVGKYKSGTFSDNINVVVDKPHNMYMGMTVGTGGISVLAFLFLAGIYIVQSARIYWKADYSNYCTFAGVGIFLGIVGFLASGLVNDSSVSVMPMYYGLLGTGIAINMMLVRLSFKSVSD